MDIQGVVFNVAEMVIPVVLFYPALLSRAKQKYGIKPSTPLSFAGYFLVVILSALPLILDNRHGMVNSDSNADAVAIFIYPLVTSWCVINGYRYYREYLS